MSEEQPEYKVKLKGRGGPGRGQGAPKGNSNATKEPGQKRIRINLTLALSTLEYLNELKTTIGNDRKSFGKLIDQIAEEHREATAEVDRKNDEFWRAMDNANFVEG